MILQPFQGLFHLGAMAEHRLNDGALGTRRGSLEEAVPAPWSLKTHNYAKSQYGVFIRALPLFSRVLVAREVCALMLWTNRERFRILDQGYMLRAHGSDDKPNVEGP